jgi:N-dimethylarginine dimethylaminohydrolase
MARVLMCSPRHYAIQYEINPWMKLSNAIHPVRAQAQWDALYQMLRKLDVDVQLVPQKKNCPDMVFTANAGIVDGRTFIPSHFRYKERQPETPAFVSFFKRKGFHVADVAKDVYFEGEGDLLGYRDMLIGGYRYRSELSAHEKVSAAMRQRLVSLELAHPRFYHLDTCFFPLDDRTVFYYPGAFDAYGRKVIQRFVENPVAVQKPDAYQFACNAFRVGKKVVMNVVSRALKKELHALGYEAVETPTSEFVKAGGSVKCLLLKL